MILPRETLEKMSKSELITLVLAQGEQILAQGEQLIVQADRIKALEKRVEELERRNARSAAPFSKNKRKMDPQRPGRKIGQGKFENRAAPAESEMTQIELVEMEIEVCGCGGALEDWGAELVSVTDIQIGRASCRERVCLAV